MAPFYGHWQFVKMIWLENRQEKRNKQPDAKAKHKLPAYIFAEGIRLKQEGTHIRKIFHIRQM